MNLRISSIAFTLLLLIAPAVKADVDTASAATPAVATLDGNQLLAELTRQLTERFQLRGELKLSLQRGWVAPVPVAGGYQVAVVEFPQRLTSSLLIHIRLQTATQTFGEQVLALHAQQMRDVYVARTPIERESLLDPAQLDVRSVDVLKERDVVAVQDCEGDFTYTTSIQAGRVLAWRDLAKRALVRKGQIIEVSAVDGTLTITTKALAMENGAAGDVIKVRNMTSKKDFTAYVVAEAQAQVRF
jgi:flagella basal body P-ring formation protein FlgA